MSKRLCKTATLGSSFGPNEKAKEPLLETHSGRIATHSRMEKPPLGGWGALGTKKRGVPTRSPCYCKDTKKVACLQMQGEKGGQK